MDKYYTCNCGNDMDLVMVFDGSKYIQPTTFTNVKNLANTVITKLSTSTKSVSIGTVQYGNDAVVQMSLTPFSQTFMKNNITSMSQLKGNSALTQGLLAAIKMLKNGRANVKKTILVFTAGNIDSIGTLYPTCNSLVTQYGVDLATIGGSNCVDPTTLGANVNTWRPYTDNNLWKIVVVDIGCLSSTCQTTLKSIGYTSNYYFSLSSDDATALPIALNREVCDKAYFDTHKGLIQNEINSRAPVPPFNDD